MRTVPSEALARQGASAVDSSDEIHRAALAAAEPMRGLTWLDIGCGRGDLLREIEAAYQPAALTGTDVIGWLPPDLAARVNFVEGPAEDVLGVMEPQDRV